MAERTSNTINIEPHGWTVQRNYSVDAQTTVERMSAGNSLVEFQTGPRRKSAIVYDPERVRVVVRRIGFQAREMQYAIEQLEGEGHEVVGHDLQGNVYGLIEFKKDY